MKLGLNPKKSKILGFFPIGNPYNSDSHRSDLPRPAKKERPLAARKVPKTPRPNKPLLRTDPINPNQRIHV